jgi:hypothetical protein
LWQISHFGWIPQAAIRRSLIISGGPEIPAAALAERLRGFRNVAQHPVSDVSGLHNLRSTMTIWLTQAEPCNASDAGSTVGDRWASMLTK